MRLTHIIRVSLFIIPLFTAHFCAAQQSSNSTEDIYLKVVRELRIPNTAEENSTASATIEYFTSQEGVVEGLQLEIPNSRFPYAGSARRTCRPITCSKDGLFCIWDCGSGPGNLSETPVVVMTQSEVNSEQDVLSITGEFQAFDQARTSTKFSDQIDIELFSFGAE